MSFLRILVVSFFLIAIPANAKEFDEAVKQNHFYVKPSQQNLTNLHEASTLVISCVDFRLRDEIEQFLRNHLYLLDNYDEIALPGASLAFVQKEHKEWSKTIEDTVGILKKLHNIKRVVFVDHMECGAYKLIYGEDATKSRDLELTAHKHTLREARQMMKKKFPELEVFSFIMDLAGNVEQIKE